MMAGKTGKKISTPVFSNVEPELKQRLVDYATKNCDGNESMAIRVIIRSYLDNYEKNLKSKKTN